MLVLALAALAAAIFGWARYRDPVNPLTAVVVSQVGLFTIFSGFVATRLDPFGQTNPEAAIRTAQLAMVHLAGLVTPYLFRGPTPARLFAGLLRFAHLSSPGFARRFDPVKLLLILLAGGLSFLALAVLGGGGALWLTDSRTAYQFYRSGAGPFFALTQWCFTFGLLYTLWARRPKSTVRTFAYVLAFCVPLLFLGSKGFVLTQIIVGVLYRHFLVRRIPWVAFAAVAPLLLGAQMALQILQGTAGTLLDTALYFRDYFATTAQFLDRFDEFGHYNGRVLASELWFFVPRAIYPDKPFEYGALLIHKVLFPGLAEMSHTPGILIWAGSYLDFGVVGVFAAGVVSALVQRMAYEHFLSHRDSFFAFVLMSHLAIWHIWMFAPLPIMIVLLLIQAFVLRLVMVSPEPRAAPGGLPAG